MKKTIIPIISEAYAIGLQPSMSWAWHLLECSFAYGKELERGEASEPARYGSAYHELQADLLNSSFRKGKDHLKNHPLSARLVAKRWGVASNVEELRAHVKAGHHTLETWLKKNEFRIDFDAIRKQGTALVETAVALKPGVSGRSIPPHDEDHRYHGLVLGEQPGTLDLAIIPPKRLIKKLPILVEDHKTGDSEDFSRPLDKAQLLSLAAGTMRWVGATEAVVAVLHARRRGMPKVYADRVKLSELAQYEGRIGTALSRIGDGSMRPGPWCARCPAQSVCPARDSELLARAGDVLTGLTAAGGALSNGGVKGTDLAIRSSSVMTVDKKMGLLYSVVKKAEALAGRARAEIKNAIIASEGALLPETPDGEYLIVRSYEKENLSKSGIIEAYGKRAGERVLKKLRADGAISKTKVEQLWPEKERGH